MMSTRTLRLFEDRLLPGAKAVHLPAGDRAVHVREGGLELVLDRSSQWIGEGGASATGEQATLHNGPEETVLWRWELDPSDLTDQDGLFRSAPETTSELRLKADVELDDRFTWLMRCDTVSFPPGGVALTHVHQGPGIRIVRNGRITIETEGTRNEYGPGEAWMEKGVLPVFAPTTPQEPTTFVRCFLLPSQSKGVSSIRIVDPADRSAPNTQTYRVLAERVLDR